MTGATWDEVGEMLGDADDSVIRQVIETGASMDEIGAALAELEDRSARTKTPATELIAQLRKILAPLYEQRDEGTFSVIGVPI